MSMWVVAVVLLLGGHSSISYLVPLDEEVQKTFGGLLRWALALRVRRSRLLGTLSPGPSGFPIAGFFVAVTGGTLLCLAALALRELPRSGHVPAALGQI